MAYIAFEIRFLPTSHLNGRPPHVDKDTRSADFTPRSSSDPVLTAFAQLGALRLDAQRVLISLFGRHEQHILTESTRTLSLQDDADHTVRDELWVGSCTMSYDRSLCKPLLHSLGASNLTTDQVWIVPDLAEDTEFKDHPDVTNYPNIRFLAASPILSPKGLAIGAYTILDDKPRASIDPAAHKFLSDMAITVMDYLEAVRGRSQHLRAERMIVGIGSFLEGKGSLRNSWLDTAGKLDDPKADQEEIDNRPEGTVNKMQQEKQVTDDASKAIRGSGPMSKSLPIRSHGERKHRRKSSATQKLHRSPMKPLPETAMPTGLGWTENPEPKKGHHAQLEEAFSRGANIIRESIEVEATIFFDANFSSRGAFVTSDTSDHESSGRDSYSSASGDDGPVRGPSSTKSSEYTTAQADNSGQDALKPCRVLGFATSHASSVNDESMGDKRIAISEPFLAGLLRRYPQGKIFNFSADGSISASETSDSYFKNFATRSGERGKGEDGSRRPARRYKRTRRAILRQDAETLLQLAPDSRSIIFSPLWDSHKGRWYSASIAWTRSPHRVFTSDDELSFLFAFGNSIMAEVHRLGALFSEQAKSSLLAGLSHELRSPLHGIFGMTDLLNTSVMNTLQRGFVHTISSCAFTLLGSVNNLLEYASIKDTQATLISAQTDGQNGAKAVKAGEGIQGGEGYQNTPVQLAAVVEDAVEAVFAGYAFFNGSQFPTNAVHASSPSGAVRVDPKSAMQIILDVAGAADSTFLTQAGAWHVILTNIIGNALKFTQNGSVFVSLEESPTTTLKNGGIVKSRVLLTVRDSGCGIGTDFLQNDIFAAFSQEDSMTTGNGLGLSITQRIVTSLGGSIEMDSQRGVGTEVKVSIDLDHTSSSDQHYLQDTVTESSLARAKGLVRQKSAGFLGHWSPGSTSDLRSSLEDLCKKCFQMEVHSIPLPSMTSSKCDFYILFLDSSSNAYPDLESLLPSAVGELSSPVIVICPSPTVAHSMFVESRKQSHATIVEFISQPCGPRKLAKTFEICSARQRRASDSAGTDYNISRRLSTSSPTKPGEPERRKFNDVPVPESGDGAGTESSKGIEPERSSDQSAFQSPPDLQPTSCSASNDHATVSGLEKASDLSQPPHELSLTVLLVDDNEINVRILVEFMKKLGCNYATASNGLEALEFFKEHAPSIAVIFMGALRIAFTSISITV